MEYDQWVKLGQDIPQKLRQLNGVNTEDKTQVYELLVPLFSKNKGAVDFYLSQVVFPRAAREFQFKLPTSPWDLVEDKKNITTGFSGTNDNRFLLPTSIIQEDPHFVLSTNALVLQHLLLPENNYYECTEGPNGERESAVAFLQRLVDEDPEIRVLLDVGAQMLELRNEELARHWLKLRPDISAAIFLNDSDHLTVVTPDGTLEAFISSPFNRQLDKCVVYLDEAHTRGTDLKLPKGMRAAVTLGPKVTKDRLVQGKAIDDGKERKLTRTQVVCECVNWGKAIPLYSLHRERLTVASGALFPLEKPPEIASAFKMSFAGPCTKRVKIYTTASHSGHSRVSTIRSASRPIKSIVHTGIRTACETLGCNQSHALWKKCTRIYHAPR